jgi:hypothetical protein
MDAVSFLELYFSKLTKDDFNKTPVLTSFYNYFKKSSKTDMFPCYIDFIIRNKDFESNDDRNEYLDDLYKKLVKDIAGNDSLTDGRFKLNKAHSLSVLHKYICDSSIITYEDPSQSGTIEDEQFRNDTIVNIEHEIIGDGRVLPEVNRDAELNKRSKLMNIWRDTEDKCRKLCDDESMMQALSKIYHIDTSMFARRISSIMTSPDTQFLYESGKIGEERPKSYIPVIQLDAAYSNASYNTIVRVINADPVFEVKAKAKSVYICAGSAMVQGGNADQGLSVTESTLYLTTTYSIGISKALHSYPMAKTHVLLCPNVLVFKDEEYKTVSIDNYKRISVLCAPSLWRPKLTNKTMSNLSELNAADYIYHVDTRYESRDRYNFVRQTLSNVFEIALFRGYDTVVLDDRGICDNVLPCHETATILRDVINTYKGRFCEICICVTNPIIFNIYKQYIA